MEDRSCQTQVKGSVTSCDLGINPHFFTTPVDSLKAKRQLGPLDDDIVPKKRSWRREETAKTVCLKTVRVKAKLTINVLALHSPAVHLAKAQRLLLSGLAVDSK